MKENESKAEAEAEAEAEKPPRIMRKWVFVNEKAYEYRKKREKKHEMKGMDEDFYFYFSKESKKVKDEYLTLPYV